jgi:hypothetical protein
LYFLGSSGPGKPAGGTVVIRNLAGRSSTFDLAGDRTVEVDGVIGKTVISIESGTVRFVSSCCPHGLCVKKGRVLRVGDWIACLPNGVIAEVEGDAAYDGITP